MSPLDIFAIGTFLSDLADAVPSLVGLATPREAERRARALPPPDGTRASGPRARGDAHAPARLIRINAARLHRTQGSDAGRRVARSRWSEPAGRSPAEAVASKRDGGPMSALSPPLLWTFGFLLGCAGLRTSSRYAHHLTPALTWVAVVLAFAVLFALSLRTDTAPERVLGRDPATISFLEAL
ncbi:hypothetical protein M446_6935 [Methylobacterium sp. 4-46]|uniref:hypothetical protein n=1 Tax=unclassified Methylobacterium TaxID=2615210 RepID=UPI000165CB8F|nr:MULTISPECIES: hypothetical protein [Methylobacterium]ACA21169.1 hypothetical protein M446_6935 [Methylobacterium sp. 4-46]WFT80316.1 hypothetical protein QA634_35010 [Methylobacterium nodulans]